MNSELLLYTTEDGAARIDVRLVEETVWLTQAQLGLLFDKDKRTISEHISNVYDEGEQPREATVRKFRTVQTEGNRQVERDLEYYNLDVIISVGYRVKSLRGTQFRQWATARLREYIVKGFTLDDKRLAEGRTATDYFDELIDRIRTIRASERNFYQKIKDIYKECSIDYNASADITQHFFQLVQNKLHWAVHGKTAPEMIASRADARKPNMGLTSWKGKKPQKGDVTVAKNYLSHDELQLLYLIVNQYLEFAELQARRRKQMTMTDWAAKLDDFLRLNDMDILQGLGRVSKQNADALAETEFTKYQEQQRLLDDAAAAEELDAEIKRVLASPKKPAGKKGKS
ncbi:MAG: virulence RhuM family protein [Holosporales bacterium]|jgi:hypothetical protein